MFCNGEYYLYSRGAYYKKMFKLFGQREKESAGPVTLLVYKCNKVRPNENILILLKFIFMELYLAYIYNSGGIFS